MMTTMEEQRRQVIRPARFSSSPLSTASRRTTTGEVSTPAGRTTTVQGLLSALTLAEVGPDHYRGGSVTMNLLHLFGGQVLGQALVAASKTIDTDKTAHSLHAYFLRAGNTREPIDYVVERVRDGRRLACRSVSAIQGGKAIATVLISFAATSGGVDHQRQPPGHPGPDEVPTLELAAQSWGGLGPSWSGFEAIDIRVEPSRRHPDENGAARAEDSADFIWMRATAQLPPDPVLHQAVLAYLSDIMPLAASLVPHGVPLGQDEGDGRKWDGVSLDHAIWFHRPVRVDDWLLFDQVSPFAGSGRSLTNAQIFTEDGVLVASVAQEGLIIELE
jgi:acyl-CoA thioesterase-2